MNLYQDKNNEIEVLRAIAICFVVLAHLNLFMTWNPKWIQLLNLHTQFWGGVDLFLCISGYVITKSLLRFFNENKDIPIKTIYIHFLIKRFYRLIPASWLFILITLTLSLIYNNSGIFGKPSANLVDVIVQFFYLSNYRYYLCVNGIGECGNNALYWSLSLEEQFYLLFPILLFIFKRKIIYLLIALIIIQFPIHRPMFSFGWIIRTDAIAWGCLIAFLSSNALYKAIQPKWLANKYFRILITTILIICLAFFTAGIPSRHLNLALIAFNSAIMVWLCSYNQGFMFRNLQNSRIILWIASRSYSIYLSHMISFYFVMETLIRYKGKLSSNDTLIILLGGCLTTFILSEGSYRFLEKPFRDNGKLIAKKYLKKYIEK